MKMRTTDFLIIGAGIMGLSLAWELQKRYPDQTITVLEKEAQLGCHASGRNSGVLHSGIYYPEGSLKAQLCAQGAAAWKAYCQEYHLPVSPIGKVILPTQAADDATLDLLYARGQANGAQVVWLDEQSLHQIEPTVAPGISRALYVPQAAVVDPLVIVQHLAQQLATNGAAIYRSIRIQQILPDKRHIRTNHGDFAYGYVYNAAGLYADSIAQAFGVGRQYTILPFKGLYYALKPGSPLRVNGLIYPVPDLSMPFLGVHFTRAVSGQVYVGPTAIPALGREHYGFLQGLDPSEMPHILARLCGLYIQNRQFRRYTHTEAFRWWKPCFVQAAKALVPALQPSDLVPSTHVGIRAQLLNLDTGQLVMDFRVAHGEQSTHILNAVSPAFTSAMPFARWVLDQCPTPKTTSAATG